MPKLKYYDGSQWQEVGASANKVTITDAGSLIAATDVEGALQESFNKIGNLSNLNTSDKTNIVNAINSHLADYITYEGKKYSLNNPYKNGGSLSLKGQMHCHTTNSDGINSPVNVVTAYKNAGYDFVSITDHDYLTPDPAIADIVFIPGVEDTSVRHITAYDIDAQSLNNNIQDIINFYRSKSQLCSIAHPAWPNTFIEKIEMSGYYDYNFTEVYNGVTGTYAENNWDWVLSTGKKVFALAVDDCHDTNGYNFNKAWIVVKANVKSKGEILQALRDGNFYASTGNDISISVVNNVITASSTGASNISFIGLNGRVLQTSNGVTSATYTIKGDELYVRVKSVKVADSTAAWSQPVFVDCIGDDGRTNIDVIKTAYKYGIERQAIINGNFDIWQRGTSFTNPASETYTADRWKVAIANTGILPTITISRQLLSGEIPTSFYYYRIATDGAGSAFGTNDIYNFARQRIENGVRYLCGAGKKVTISFWARSSIPNKKIGIKLAQIYGTGGTPSSNELLPGTTWTLNSYWTKYTYTFTTNTITGKTFGTNNDDFLELSFACMWGATRASEVSDTVAETFVGAGNIDIAQVQLCSGDQALPFAPRSFADELRLCQRYFEKSFPYDVAPYNATSFAEGFSLAAIGMNNSATKVYCEIPFKVEKRVAPTITFYSAQASTSAGRWASYDTADHLDLVPTAYALSSKLQVTLAAAGLTAGQACLVMGNWTADAEL